MVFVNHGDDEAAKSYVKCLSEEYGFTASAPYSGAEFDLIRGVYVVTPSGIPIEKRRAKAARASSAYDNLVAAGEKLMALIHASKGIPNKELIRFAGQINALTSKWQSWATKKK